MAKNKNEMPLYIGVHPESASKGIYVCRFDADNGRLSELKCEIEGVGVLFAAFHPNGNFLYAVGDGGEQGEGVFAFSISEGTDKLTFLSHVSLSGALPCHITIDKTGRYALAANYSGGSVAVFPIWPNGLLSEASCIIKHHGSSVNLDRQEGPHPHCILLDADNHFAFAADLGLDEILMYRFDADRGELIPHDPPFVLLRAGSGPRHFIFHPQGRHGFLTNELSNTITVFQYDPSKGTLAEIQTLSMIPDDWKRQTYASEIQVHPCGRYIYGANRGHDSIGVFEFNQDSGKLRLIEIHSCGGRWPDHFCIDPSGKWLLAANRKSNTIVVFRIDAGSGRLIETGNFLEVPSPGNIQFGEV